MRSAFLSVVLLLLAATADAQTKIMPAPGMSVAGLVSEEGGSQWSAFAVDWRGQRFVQVQLVPLEATIGDKKVSILLIEGPPGSDCAVTRFVGSQQKEQLTVKLGGVPAPKPNDPPNPQEPLPGEPVQGFRVLLLEESSPSSALSKTQQEALHHPSVLQYLDSKAVDTTGMRRWRRLDPQAPVTNLPKVWQDMRAAATGTNTDQPQLIIAGSVGGSDKVIFVGPYPDTTEKALALLKKYGG